ncbi:MAG TPA: hypothetical protein PLS35_18780 [Nitrospira sp.]|nr:hypothetical protein [Nitrospira sp.]
MSTIPAPARRGLIPAVSGLFSAVSRPASRINLDRIAIGLVFFAGVVTILKKNGVDVPSFMVLFGCSLGIAGLLYEMSASRSMMRAFWEAKPFSMFCNLTIWVAAFSFSIFNWIGAAAEGQAEKTNIQKAAFVHSADARTRLDMAQDALKKARNAAQEKHNAAWETIPVVDGQKITDRGQAEALIAKIKSNTRYWNLTNECQTTKGPQTRKYCADYNDAKAALSWADTHPALIEAANAADQDVKRLEQEVASARSEASSTKVVTSEDRADLFMLTDWGGMSESRAQQLTGLISVLVISVFISFGSMRDEAARLTAEGPRRKWSFLSRTYRWAYRKVWGQEPDNTTYVTNYLDPRGAEALAAVERDRERITHAARAAQARLNPLGAFA